MVTDTLKIEGMTFINCARHVKSALESVDGVISAEVSLELGEARIERDTVKVAPAAVISAVTEAGYNVTGP